MSASQISKLHNIFPVGGAPGFVLKSCHFGIGGLKPLKLGDLGSLSGKSCNLLVSLTTLI